MKSPKKNLPSFDNSVSISGAKKPFRIGYSVIGIIFAIILLASVIRITFGSTEFSFAYFLDYISKSPQISFGYVELFNISGNWSLLDPIRVFINSLGSIISFILWLCQNLLNGLSYLFYFIKFVFV